MADDHHHQKSPSNPQNPKVSGEIGRSSSHIKPNYPNPPDIKNPDAAALREQWKYAIRQYSKWYSHAWGTAILAGVSFFALGWVIKGGNPLPSFHQNDDTSRDPPNSPTDSPDVNRTH
ncbi:unnamed protein product [Lactuca saligna]|uniref:Uncharacterized protein n=1 Tax=Lactuca saligna TaxID=75948 RepID=A0AA35Y1K0_LACSI|nr:unnamed protein product [Lactuca saligna]